MADTVQRPGQTEQPWAQPPDSLDDAYLIGDARGTRPYLWLGTHMVNWLGDPRFADVPLFVSRRRLERIRPVSWPHASGPWAMDSGAFTEASQYGQWTITPAEYVTFCREVADRVGNLSWVAPMDLCCEPSVVEHVARNGWLADQVTLPPGSPDDPVLAHLVWTVRNYLRLRDLFDRPDDPHVIPVVQGWTLDHYHWCLQLYDMAGVDLCTEPVVGIGSTCRRDAELSILAKVALLGEAGISRIHAFGLKGAAVSVCAHRISSCDSLAWSYWARRRGRPVGEHCTHPTCQNCPEAALAWRDRLLHRTDMSLNRFRTVAASWWPLVVTHGTTGWVDHMP
jgi:hypothetical protein